MCSFCEALLSQGKTKGYDESSSDSLTTRSLARLRSLAGFFTVEDCGVFNVDLGAFRADLCGVCPHRFRPSVFRSMALRI
mmetsp:Transcript_7556/g.22928  ORF Transcript_7556/g.22928 Transcript_7556/m.22928 type:complete len:80 (-) Transcript_7556:1613-1852(-)